VNTVINLTGQDIPCTVYAVFCCYILQRFTIITEMIVFTTLLQADIYIKLLILPSENSATYILYIYCRKQTMIGKILYEWSLKINKLH
jgi:hypothetical protein